MKKNYLLVFSLLLSTALSAQTEAHWTGGNFELVTTPFEGTASRNTTSVGDRAPGDTTWFDGFDTPTDWTAAGPGTNYNNNGWSIGTTVNGWFFGTTDDMGTVGNFARFTNGDPNPGGTPAPIVTGPAFTLQYNNPISLVGASNHFLEFEQYGARFFTSQYVEISTDGGLTWVEVASNDDITPLTNGGGAAYGQPETRRFSIDGVVGTATSILLRLGWDAGLNGATLNYTEYGWFVDNVRIVEGFDYDAVIEGSSFRSGTLFTDGLSYYQVPLSQITAINYEGIVRNAGVLTQTGVQLQSDASFGGTNVFTNNSLAISQASGNIDTLTSTMGFTPASGIGPYTLDWDFIGANPDGNPANDIASDVMEVTADIYARDNNVQTGAVAAIAGFAGEPLIIGNSMEFFDVGYISQAQIKVSDAPGNVGNDIFAVIFRNTPTGFQIVSVSDPHTVTAADNDSFITLDLPQSITVNAGDELLVAAGNTAGDVGFGLAQAVPGPSVTGFNPNITTSGFYNLATARAVMIRATVDDEAFSSRFDTICAGESITVGSSTYNTAGVYTDVLSTTNGDDSTVTTNLFVASPVTGSSNVEICVGSSYSIGNSTYTVPGTYTDVLSSVVTGCDSTHTTVLSIANPITISVTPLANGEGLTAVITSGETASSYTWLDCNNNFAVVPGQASAVFTPDDNGSYAVIIQSLPNNCVDTSDCFSVAGVGLDDFNGNEFSMYPNPSNGSVIIEITADNLADYTVQIIDNVGRVVLNERTITSNKMQLNNLDFAPGLYFVEVKSNDKKSIQKLLVK